MRKIGHSTPFANHRLERFLSCILKRRAEKSRATSDGNQTGFLRGLGAFEDGFHYVGNVFLELISFVPGEQIDTRTYNQRLLEFRLIIVVELSWLLKDRNQHLLSDVYRDGLHFSVVVYTLWFLRRLLPPPLE